MKKALGAGILASFFFAFTFILNRSMHLGGGRETADSAVDLAVGVTLNKKRGDAVAAGESLATIHARSEAAAEAAAVLLRRAYSIGPERPEAVPFVKAVVRAEG